MNDVDPTALEQITASMERIQGTTHHGNIDFDAPAISYIDTNLCQGGYVPGVELPRMFKHIISLYPWGRWKLGRRMDTELYVSMYDSVDQSLEQVDAIARLVNVCRQTGPTFVHCQAGLNRSSLIVARALYLQGRATGMPCDGGAYIAQIRNLRSPACLCNPAFEAEVRSWE